MYVSKITKKCCDWETVKVIDSNSEFSCLIFAAFMTSIELQGKNYRIFLHTRYGRSGVIFGALSISLQVPVVSCRLYFMVMEDSD